MRQCKDKGKGKGKGKSVQCTKLPQPGAEQPVQWYSVLPWTPRWSLCPSVASALARRGTAARKDTFSKERKKTMFGLAVGNRVRLGPSTGGRGDDDAQIQGITIDVLIHS